MTNLFRKEVIQFKSDSIWENEETIPTMFSIKIIIIISIILIFSILMFVFYGSYTERKTVSGYLIPMGGITKIFSQNSGIVKSVFIKDNQHIQANAPLLIIQSQQYGQQGDYNSQIKSNLQDRLPIINNQHNVILDDYKRKREIVLEDINNLDNKIRINRLQNQINARKLLLAENKYDKYYSIIKDGAISELELEIVQKEILDLNEVKNSLQDEYDSLISQKNTKDIELKQLMQGQQKDLNEIKIQESVIKQSLLEIDKQITTVVKSPVNGKVTNLNTHSNQLVNNSNLLLSIIPDNTTLQASLLISPSDIGFIKKNDDVVIRYDAFPYQKYGQAKGKISSISKTAINPIELGIEDIKVVQNQKNYYIANVILEKQYFIADGVKKELMIGMTLNADILLQKRKIYEWILEPLNELKERAK